MENALIIGASGGIGSAIAKRLERDGVTVKGLSRTEDGLDVTDTQSVEKVLGDVEGSFDLIFVAVGILGTPEKALEAIGADEMARVMAVNTIGPALILRHVPRLLAKEGVCAVLSARVGSIGDNKVGGWHSYRASKAAVNQIVHGAAIELARTHKGSKVVALHPGTVETEFTAKYAGKHKMVSADEAAGNLLKVCASLTPEQSGGFFAYDGARIEW